MNDKTQQLERQLEQARQENLALEEALAETRRGQASLNLELEDRVDMRTAQLQRHAEQQAAVARLGQIALSSRGMDLVRKQAVEAATRILEMENGLLFEYDREARALVLRAATGPIRARHDGADDCTMGGWAPEDLEDPLAAWDRMRSCQELRQMEIGGGITVLIGASHDPLGVLCIFTHKDWTVRQDDSVFLESVANVVASAWAREQAEEARARLIKELERSNDELKQFAYVASHDLQEPLRTVGSFVQLLARRYQGELDQDADDFIEFILDGVTRMRGLINDLLRYSRVGTSTEPLEEVPSQEAVDRALANLQLALDECDAEVVCGELPTVRADRAQLVQLFQNMLGNAIKFRSEVRPRLEVWAEREADMWRFSVRDNGIGIQPQFRETIFLIFKRLHTREEYSGSGIGLSLCKRIMDRHDGEIWVEPGDSGSTFCFTLPAL